jgi:hypothetical protein
VSASTKRTRVREERAKKATSGSSTKKAKKGVSVVEVCGGECKRWRLKFERQRDRRRGLSVEARVSPEEHQEDESSRGEGERSDGRFEHEKSNKRGCGCEGVSAQE